MSAREELFRNVFFELAKTNVIIHQCVLAGRIHRMSRDETMARMVIALAQQNAELKQLLMNDQINRPPVVILSKGGAA